jgi:dienelactone hydrolase
VTHFSRLAVMIGAVACLMAASVACAQEEFPPPQGGTAHVVVVASGMSGPEHYRTVARAISQMGYDVVLFDGNQMEGTHGDGVKQDILQAQQMPHALGGKVALVGFSLGGGMVLYYGTQWPDLVTGAVVWYPATTFIKDVPGWVGRTKVPVLMFAGENDTFRNCCLIGQAHALADAAAAGGLAFQLVTYPKTDHDFVKDGAHYNGEAYSDALQKTAEKLKEFFGN